MGTFDLPWIRKIAAIAVLGDENRRKLYEYVLNAGSAVGRDEAALTLGLPPRSSVSFHLDRLVREGLLQVEFRKSPDRTGPGSGRPSKLYRPMVDEIGVSIPERHYDLAGHLMAAAIQRAESDGAPVEAACVRSLQPGEASWEGLAISWVRSRSLGTIPPPMHPGGDTAC